MEKNVSGKAHGMQKKNIAKTDKNQMCGGSADLSSQMDKLIAKNTAQLAQNFRTLNIPDDSQGYDDDMG